MTKKKIRLVKLDKSIDPRNEDYHKVLKFERKRKVRTKSLYKGNKH